MGDQDPTARYLALKEAGASPRAVYAAAGRDGLPLIQRIRVLRLLFGMALGDAKALADSVDGPKPGARSEVRSRNELVELLKRELGYCSCGGEDALAVLRALLAAARDRTDAAGRDAAAFAGASRAVEACLRWEEAGAMAGWFVFGLEQRDLVWHGFRVADLWITEKGRKLLRAIEQFGSEERGE